MALLEVKDLGKHAEGTISVQHIEFVVEPLQKIAIAGETGSGKTTILKLIAGLVQPTQGMVLLNGERVLGPDEKLIPGHPHIAYLSQHFELRNNYWVREILEYANLMSDDEANTLYEICDIKHLIHRRTDQLSGGEKQRIALARLLSTKPKLLLLDEPFSNLDMLHKQTIQRVINDIGKRLSITCMMVSHDAPDILSWADKMLVMRDGKIIQQGTPQEIYYTPVDAYCAGLFGDYYLFDEILLKIFGVQANAGKRLLVRSEQITIKDVPENGIAATVVNQSFWGSFTTVDVQLNEQLLTVKTMHAPFTLGSTVYLSLLQEHVWWL